MTSHRNSYKPSLQPPLKDVKVRPKEIFSNEMVLEPYVAVVPPHFKRRVQRSATASMMAESKMFDHRLHEREARFNEAMFQADNEMQDVVQGWATRGLETIPPPYSADHAYATSHGPHYRPTAGKEIQMAQIMASRWTGAEIDHVTNPANSTHDNIIGTQQRPYTERGGQLRDRGFNPNFCLAIPAVDMVQQHRGNRQRAGKPDAHLVVAGNAQPISAATKTQSERQVSALSHRIGVSGMYRPYSAQTIQGF